MRWESSFSLWFAAASVVLALLLSGCSTPPAQVPFPYEAAQACVEPPVDKTTNGGLAKGVADLRASLRQCNNDKAIIREWLGEKDVSIRSTDP